jgi:ribosomal-protein-alanine N-acetyltransferase
MGHQSLFPTRIETDRLLLERLCHDNVDLQEYYRICSSDEAIDEITEYVTWSPHETLKETKEYIDTVEAEWNDGDGASYLIQTIEPSETGEIVGAAGLSIDWDRRAGTLGTWLRKAYWGRGYSGERAAALIDLAFEQLDLEIIEVSHHPANDKSQRAIEKYIEAHGGQRDGVLRNGLVYQDGTIVDIVHYSITRDEYQEAVDT